MTVAIHTYSPPIALNEREDTDLVLQIKDGVDSDLAYAVLVDRHRSYVENTCRFLMGGDRDVEDRWCYFCYVQPWPLAAMARKAYCGGACLPGPGVQRRVSSTWWRALA